MYTDPRSNAAPYPDIAFSASYFEYLHSQTELTYAIESYICLFGKLMHKICNRFENIHLKFCGH